MKLKPRVAHLDVLDRWVRYTNKYNLGNVLYDNNIRTIAIYGGGYLGRILYEHLMGTKITIKYIVDKNKQLRFPYEVEIIHPDDAFLLKSVDALIVTVDFFRVEEMLANYVECISLDELIVDIDELALVKKVKDYIKENGANLILAELVSPLTRIKNPTSFEKYLSFGDEKGILFFLDNLEGLKPYYDDVSGDSMEYIKEVFVDVRHTMQRINRDGILHLNDMKSKYYNVINNCRLTTDTPDIYDNSIYFHGNCIAIGRYAEDKYTIESYLQRKINQKGLGSAIYRVVNKANWSSDVSSFKQILDTPLKSGDYVILISTDMISRFRFYISEDNVMRFVDLVPAFNRPHEFDEVFFDTIHMNHRGYKLIADYLYKILSNEIKNDSYSFKNIGCEQGKPSFEITKAINNTQTVKTVMKKDERINNYDLELYLQFLDDNKVDNMDNKVIGSVVVNCNPFTYGHKYLIEQALKKCDFLYVFVVEEDKSFFPFKDRIECVRRGLEDLENIKILPSGKFIISTVTFPEYFIKDTYSAIINASFDVKLFATKIAPKLNIRKRFVGQEPKCQVTRQYNQALLDYLPKYGIELIVFERKKAYIDNNEEPISASKVRQLLSEKKYDDLKTLIPPSTYKFLEEKNFYNDR